MYYGSILYAEKKEPVGRERLKTQDREKMFLEYFSGNGGDKGC